MTALFRSFEHAGLVWYVNDDNYVSLFQEVLSGKVELQMVTEKAAKPRFAVAHHEAKGVWMRLVIDGGKITSQYRPTEKEAWKVVGQSDLPAAGTARVGVMAGGVPKDAERYVRFRTFRIVENQHREVGERSGCFTSDGRQDRPGRGDRR